MNSPSAVTSWLSTGRIRARKDEHMAKNSVICILLIGIVIAILPRTAWSMLYIPWNGENAVYQKAQTDTDTAGLQSMIKGTATGINWPYKIAVNSSNIFLVNASAFRVDVWNVTDDGNTAPVRSISGADTGLGVVGDSYVPAGIAIDQDHIFVSVTYGPPRILVYNLTDSGNVALLKVMTGGATGLTGNVQPGAMAIDGDDLYVAMMGAGSGTLP